MLRKPFLVLGLLFLAAIDVGGAQAVVRQDAAGAAQTTRSGTWSATTGGRRTLAGTWTAVPDPTGRAVTGTWTLVDGKGRTVARGAWSAAKSPARWTGAWRAVVSGRGGEYAGTWTTGIDLKAGARFVDLFETAVRTVVSGTWRAGRRSGSWSIRALE